MDARRTVFEVAKKKKPHQTRGNSRGKKGGGGKRRPGVWRKGTDQRVFSPERGEKKKRIFVGDQRKKKPVVAGGRKGGAIFPREPAREIKTEGRRPLAGKREKKTRCPAGGGTAVPAALKRVYLGGKKLSPRGKKEKKGATLSPAAGKGKSTRLSPLDRRRKNPMQGGRNLLLDGEKTRPRAVGE